MNKLLIGLLLTSSLTTIPAYSSDNNKRLLGEYSPKVISDDDSSDDQSILVVSRSQSPSTSSSPSQSTSSDSDFVSPYNPEYCAYFDLIEEVAFETDQDKYTTEQQVFNTEFSAIAPCVDDIVPWDFIDDGCESYLHFLPVIVKAPTHVIIHHPKIFHNVRFSEDLKKSAAAFLYLYYSQYIQQETSSLVRKTINHIFNTTYTDDQIEKFVRPKIIGLPPNVFTNEEEKKRIKDLYIERVKTLATELKNSNPKLYSLLCNYVQMYYWLESSNDAYVLFRTLNRAFSYLKKDGQLRNALKKIYNAFIIKMKEKGEIVGKEIYVNLIRKKLKSKYFDCDGDDAYWFQVLSGKALSEDECIFCVFLICSAISSLSPTTIEDRIENLLKQDNLLDTYQNILANPKGYLNLRFLRSINCDPEQYRNPAYSVEERQKEMPEGFLRLVSSTEEKAYAFLATHLARVYQGDHNRILDMLINRIFGMWVENNEADAVNITENTIKKEYPEITKAKMRELMISRPMEDIQKTDQTLYDALWNYVKEMRSDGIEL